MAFLPISNPASSFDFETSQSAMLPIEVWLGREPTALWNYSELIYANPIRKMRSALPKVTRAPHSPDGGSQYGINTSATSVSPVLSRK